MKKIKLIKTIDVLLITLFLSVGFIPYLSAMDKIAPQYFYLSLLCIFSSVYLIFTLNKISFKYASIILYALFLFSIIGLSSVTFAINKSEVLIETSRVFIFLLSFSIFYLIINRNKDLIKYIPYLISIILIIELSYVYERFIERYTWGKSYTRDMGLRAFTGNINITAFNFLLKFPFLIYSISKIKISIIIKLLVLISFSFCLFLLGSRGANLLLFIVFFMIVILYFLFRARSFLNKKTLYIVFFGIIVGGISNYLVFNNDKNLNIIERTTNLNTDSTKQRLRFYSSAIKSIKENPILGVGIGNWKIHGTKYDLTYMSNYTVPYHVHNDFLEIFAELGVFGFILFFGSIFWILYLIFKSYYSKEFIKIKHFNIVLLVFISIMVYLADSFLNFPFTRPVIQIQNLFYWALALVILGSKLNIQKKIMITYKNNNFYRVKALVVVLIISLFTITVSKKVFNSFVDQQFLTAAGNGSYTNYSKEQVYSINSEIPSITATTIPIETLKANLIYNIGELDDTLHYMIDQGEKQNPFLPYNELTRGVLFIKERKPDSAYHYAKKAYYGLPNSIIHFNLLMDIAEAYKDSLEIEKAMNYFRGELKDEFYEKYLITSYNIKNEIGLNESKFLEKYNSKNPNSDVARTFNAIQQVGLKNVEEGYMESINGIKFFEDKNFREAAKSFERALKLNPKEISYRENAANSYMQTGEDDKAIKILTNLIKDLNPKTGKSEYLLGIILIGKENYIEGCEYLNISKGKGFKIPDIIFKRFCNSEKLKLKND